MDENASTAKAKPNYDLIDWGTEPPPPPRARRGGPRRIEVLRDNLVTVLANGVSGRWYQVANYATRVTARRCMETIATAREDEGIRAAMRVTGREFGTAKIAKLEDGRYAAMVWLDDVEVEGDEVEGGVEE